MFVCISTRNRSEFFDWTQMMVERQTLQPKGVVIVDGSESPSSFKNWSKALYHHIPNIILGESRNVAIDSAIQAGAEFIAIWDDDDYYTEDHLEKAEKMLKEDTRLFATGSTETPIYFKKTKEIFLCGPYKSFHAAEPSLVISVKKLLEENTKFQDKDSLAQGRHFLKEYTLPIGQIPRTHILVAHRDNTFDKEQIRENPERFKATKEERFTIPDILSLNPASV